MHQLLSIIWNPNGIAFEIPLDIKVKWYILYIGIIAAIAYLIINKRKKPSSSKNDIEIKTEKDDIIQLSTTRLFSYFTIGVLLLVFNFVYIPTLIEDAHAAFSNHGLFPNSVGIFIFLADITFLTFLCIFFFVDFKNNKGQDSIDYKRDKGDDINWTKIFIYLFFLLFIILRYKHLQDCNGIASIRDFFPNPNKTMFIIGHKEIRWYGICWVLAILIPALLVQKLYQRQQISNELYTPLFFYCFFGILLGARLGHCLLYEPGYFLSHPNEIFIPIKDRGAGITEFVGFSGLASHGGTIGLMIAIWLYTKTKGIKLLHVLDDIAIATPIAACFIRLGNLMNSEIVGKPTDSAIGFVFANNHETFARYPAQLFEAMAYLLFFFIGLWLYRRYKEKVGTGFFFGWCLTSIFTFRLFVEFLKEVQEGWEISMVNAIGLNQGQMLSLPFIVLGLYCLFGGKLCRKLGEQK